MDRGLILLLSDSRDLACDLSAALGVVDIPFQIFPWNEIPALIEALKVQLPTFALCDLGDQTVNPGVLEERLGALHALKDDQLHQVPLILAGKFSQVGSDDLQSPFVGRIGLPLQFPAAPQLLQRLVTECLVRPHQTK